MTLFQQYTNIFQPASIAHRSTSIIQYPSFSSDAVIQSHHVILKFVRNGIIYVPDRILFARVGAGTGAQQQRTIIVCADDAICARTPVALAAQRKIIRILRKSENARIVLPTAFRSIFRTHDKEFEYADLNIHDALRFV